MYFIAINYLVGEEDRRVAFLCFLDEHVFCLRLRLTNNHWCVWLDDACFFGCNLSQSITEHCYVIQGNISDYAKFRFYDVGRVESSAESHLYDGDVDFFFREVVESHACSHLEERELHLLELLLVIADKINDILLRNHLSVDAYAFAEVAQVRGGVQACFVAAFLKN